ncbi:MAG: 4-hydroxythreonine-4-phosphate dehydrogenase PdxA [Chloroflexi bacterium]|nr:4-hydroxythreonine-4-phosphate dehydrogenase PdxA [Chloroflexota bacterium]MCL5110909.1 4-hydroxythreonine-4-phosphate dehydrogenase PdxA [Chloroflexota bacterium]
MTDKPVIAMALGDAAGVGPEVVAKTLADETIGTYCRPLVVGNAWVLQRALDLTGAQRELRPVARVGEARFSPQNIEILETGNLTPEQLLPGQSAIETGRESAETLQLAARLVTAGEAQGLASAPVSKAALGLAGFGHGHVEVVAQVVGANGPLTSMLAGPRLKVVNLTAHCSLLEACQRVRRERIATMLRLADAQLRQWGQSARFAVCALNPHNGESGNFGREEIEEIAPAVAEARAAGVDARGPFPVDTLFARALAGEFDVVLALYHDQGFTPVKTLAWHETASLSLGLPIPYATTDHGTGFDIAWQGLAHPGSFQAAVRAVVSMCQGAL